MKYGFNCGIWGNIFVVPGIVADGFLKIADGSQLKVLLYLLRNNGKSFDIQEIAETLDLPEDEVSDSVLFWEQHGILPSDNESSLPAVNSIFSAVHDSLPEYLPERQKNYISYSRDSSDGLNITPSEISDMLKSTPPLRKIFNIAEKYIDNVNFTVQRSLVWLYQYLGFSPEMIEIILEYCVSINKAYIWEIEAVALKFRRNGIDSPELARNEIDRLKDEMENGSFIKKIKRMFFMERDPVTRQRNFMIKWKSEEYPDELIRLAYEKSVEATGNKARIPIEYIDTILKRWKEKNITTVEQAEQDDIDFKKLFKFKKNNSTDSEKSDDGHFEEDYEIFLNNF